MNSQVLKGYNFSVLELLMPNIIIEFIVPKWLCTHFEFFVCVEG